MIHCQVIDTIPDFPIHWIGPEKCKGPLPAFFYFSLSGEESLTLAPYNSPIGYLQNLPLRVFSFTLPFHGNGFNKFQAMRLWAEQLKQNSNFLEKFLENAITALHFLNDEGWLKEDALAIGGLSRGGWVAGQIAARYKKISYLLGFAPLTSFNVVEEFIPYSKDLETKAKMDDLKLENQTSQLLHLKALRFYIGNRDICVNTDECYKFIRNCAERQYENRKRELECELFISNSIGNKGHGTAPHIFKEGALWIIKKLLGEFHETH